MSSNYCSNCEKVRTTHHYIKSFCEKLYNFKGCKICGYPVDPRAKTFIIIPGAETYETRKRNRSKQECIDYNNRLSILSGQEPACPSERGFFQPLETRYSDPEGLSRSDILREGVVDDGNV